MKKVFLSLAVLFSVALVSCGGNKAENAEDTTPVEVVEVAAVETVTPDSTCDSGNCDTTVAVAVEGAEAAPAQ